MKASILYVPLPGLFLLALQCGLLQTPIQGLQFRLAHSLDFYSHLKTSASSDGNASYVTQCALSVLFIEF